MSGWPIASLGSVVKFISGGTPSKDESRFWGGDIPWVSSAEMTQRRISDTQLHVTEDGAREGSKRVPKRTVLVVVRGMSLAKEFRVAISERDVTFNQDLKALLTTSALDPVFLFFYLLSQNNAIRDSASEAAHGTKKLDMPVLEQWPIPIPPLSIQQKIAAILSAYDDLIANNQRRIALLERMAEDIYREWFVRLRFPGHEQVRIEKGVPTGWALKKLPEICDITYGFPFQGERFNTAGVGKPIIRIRNIPNASTDDFTDEIADTKYVVRAGDLLIGMDGDFHINHWLGPDAYLVQRSCRVKAKNPLLNAYIAQAITAPIHHFQQTIVGATVGHLGAKHLNSIDILVPPDSHAKQLEMLNDLLKQKLLLGAANRQAGTTRDALLPRLISGQLAVDGLDIRFPPGMAAG